MKYMGWSRPDLDAAWPEDVEAIIQLIGEESSRAKKR